VSISRAIQAPKPDYNDPPEDYLDTISKELILDPIKLSCNHTFDKLPISKWLRQPQNRSNIKCPLCKKNVTSAVENRELKVKIEKWVKDNKFSPLYKKEIKDQKEDYKDLVDKNVIPIPNEIQRPEDEPFPIHLIDDMLAPFEGLEQPFQHALNQFPPFLLLVNRLLDPIQEIRDLIEQNNLLAAKNRALTLNYLQRNEALELIVRAYIDLNNLNMAKEIVNLIDDLNIKGQQYELIADAYISLDDFDNSALIALLSPTSYNRNNIYYEMAKKYVDYNEFIKAKEMVILINDFCTRDRNYYSLSEYLLEKNNINKSLEFANLISDYDNSKNAIYSLKNAIYALIIDKYIESKGPKDIYAFSNTMKYDFKELHIIEKLKENNSYSQIIKLLFNLNIKSLSFFEKTKITFKFFYILSFSIMADASKKTLRSISSGLHFLYKKAFKI
jgi:hypothetical protein